MKIKLRKVLGQSRYIIASLNKNNFVENIKLEQNILTFKIKFKYKKNIYKIATKSVLSESIR